MSTIHVTPELGWAMLVSVFVILVYGIVSTLRRRKAAQREAMREMARLRAQHVALTPQWESTATKRSVH